MTSRSNNGSNSGPAPGAVDEVVVGRVGRPHGVRGELSVEPRTDEPERRFAAGSALLGRREGPGPTPAPASTGESLIVAASRWHQHRLLVRFEEVTDRDAAEALRGLVLTVRVREDEAPEDPEEYYDHQLVGLAVLTTEGTPVGEVSEVMHTGAQDLLVVRRDGREDALVPFVAALVPEVDLAGRRLLVADRPGLLEPVEED